MPDDDLGSIYLLSRQLAHEYHSPEMDALRASQLEQEEPEQAYTELQKKQGQKPEVIQKQVSGLEPPDIDPVMAFAGGFGGMGASSLNQGLKLLPSLGRAITAGLVGGAADYPIGAATEALEVTHPKLAMPFNLMVGLVSGMTIENVIEKAIRKTATKAGQRLTRAKIKQQVDNIKKIFSGETDKIDIEPNQELIDESINEINKLVGKFDIKTAGADIDNVLIKRALQDDIKISQKRELPEGKTVTMTKNAGEILTNINEKVKIYEGLRKCLS